MTNKITEIWQEFQTVFSGRNNTVDAILPPLVFALLNGMAGLNLAVWIASAIAIFLTALRLVRKQSWKYALSGLFMTLLAGGLAWTTQSASGFFLPALLTSFVLLIVTLISIWTGKPLAAWSSHLTRAWPLAWYWLPEIRPAYIEVTWMWAGFIALRLSMQIWLTQQGNPAWLSWVNILLDWPVTIVVLIISYVYGIWRLNRLGGPGVDEFLSKVPPPWHGQKRGF